MWWLWLLLGVTVVVIGPVLMLRPSLAEKRLMALRAQVRAAHWTLRLVSPGKLDWLHEKPPVGLLARYGMPLLPPIALPEGRNVLRLRRSASDGDWQWTGIGGNAAQYAALAPESLPGQPWALECTGMEMAVYWLEPLADDTFENLTRALDQRAGALRDVLRLGPGEGSIPPVQA